MMSFAETIQEPPIEAGNAREAMLYRQCIERGTARKCLEGLYPKHSVEEIAFMMTRLAIFDILESDPAFVRALDVNYRQDFERALARAMKDELLQMAEGN